MSFENLALIPKIGWITILILGFLTVFLLGFLIYSMFNFFQKKNLKTQLFELTDGNKQQQQIREIYIAEGKDQLDNQCQVAKQLIKKIRIKLYSTGLDLFKITDTKEIEILELITYRISDRLNYDVRNDLTRNHISKKTDSELKIYSDAKATGYYWMIYDRLYNLNSKLPDYNLPSILDKIPISEFESVFYDIYFSARSIAGSGGLVEQSK